MTWSGRWHPLAERFPMLSEDELRDMAASIAERGQYVPCRMTPDGLGLDGRNRVAACALANVAPRWEVYDGDPVPFIVEVNAERRHLSSGQRAMAVAIGLVGDGQRSNGRFERGSVPDNPGSGVSRWKERVREAGVVLDHAPELADAVLTGDLALDGAHKQAKEIAAGKDALKALGSDLAGLVDAGVIDLAEAQRRVRDDARLSGLPDHLAERARAGSLALDEAEDIVAQNRQRVAVWGEQVHEALAVLSRMAGYPVPGPLAALLPTNEREQLDVVLDALSFFKEAVR